MDVGDRYFDLGTFTRPITTKSADAQKWFDRGLIWSYGFNHDEAVNCFRRAIEHDPDCGMAYWGIAYASGPNYNKTWVAFDDKDLKQSVMTSYDVSREGTKHAAHVTPVEAALINAISRRYPSRDLPFDFTASNQSYAEAMRDVFDKHGEDLEVRCLFADSLMMTAPRKMFDTHTGQPIPDSPCLEVKKIIEDSLEMPACKRHPGLLHLYIHLMEMSATPGVALPAADHLRTLVPDGGHLNHMPSHLDVLVGDYRRSIASNLDAIKADEKYRAYSGGNTGFYTFYRLHDYHSLIYAAMLAGQSQVALDAVDGMERSITDDLLQTKSPPLADWIEFFKSVRLHVYVRFGFWDAIKAYELPRDPELYCVTTAFAHYAKGLAWAVTGTGDLEEADKERTLFHAAAQRVPPTRKDFPNTISDELKIATAMLDGEIEYRRGNYPVAFQRLRDAIHYDDTLLYSEPWGWMLPSRHAFAALSLEQGNVEDARLAYAEDLGLDGSLTRAHQHPNNVWALHGYHECLERLGRHDEARIIAKQLELAAAVADVPVTASCFCRLEAAEPKTISCCSGSG